MKQKQPVRKNKGICLFGGATIIVFLIFFSFLVPFEPMAWLSALLTVVLAIVGSFVLFGPFPQEGISGLHSLFISTVCTFSCGVVFLIANYLIFGIETLIYYFGYQFGAGAIVGTLASRVIIRKWLKYAKNAEDQAFEALEKNK